MLLNKQINFAKKVLKVKLGNKQLICLHIASLSRLLTNVLHLSLHRVDMSLSFDDKILGEKVDNYCSSSEEGEGSDESNDEEGNGGVSGAAAPPLPSNMLSQQAAQVLHDSFTHRTIDRSKGCYCGL